MRFDLRLLDRSVLANLCRRRAEELSALVEKRTASATQKELLEDAALLRDMARRFDDGEETESAAIPKTVDKNRDLDQTNPPTKPPEPAL